ncbi:protein translocase subunit SecY [Moorella thermoacetica]|uniref:Protein translocase subunit SecY n=1 Tax=Moorella thermoacetica (strain ATCC 39073 / JCM 9320) TaxID=264732 RepID=Q2RFR7_MOOTA|nr:preprotein translocase subunit SecY [Moorella thermoacetica]AKX97925.1 protein translocase subunit SecY [Moorella thermoacetica]OIQ12158.1 protein translocase subunit SecY [Moorella thermoacetica]OIQ56756.1 protein translocase subunit SecY [Moorella thermoacetica]OIQ62436.1 protein translocase subunit SecY [Moorella thermoacetica]QDA01744.1 preprotein translocase subunit SecY [Moorella thermoacetica]
MLDTLASAWKLEDLRKKIFFTLLMFVVFRLGAHVPVPGINNAILKELIGTGTIFGFFDVISGGAFKRFTIFAMGIMPYINASIIMQLLTVVIPALERLAKEDIEGRKKIVQYTRYGTVILSILQALGMGLYLARSHAFLRPGLYNYLVVVIMLTAGTTFLMWMGEQITEKGIGNGISLIIFAGIVSRLPAGAASLYQYVTSGTVNIISLLVFAIVAVLIIAAVVAVQEGERRIAVQYAKRVVGRRVYGGQSTHIPLKVNQAGVIPVIFAMSILLFPSTLASWFPQSSLAQTIVRFFDPRSAFYMILYALLIIFFTYFYTAVTFNPQDVADNMKKYGGFIPGLRPGRPTAEYIERILARVTLAGAIFLAFIAVLPNLLMAITGINVYFGGTSLLIVVGVALETMKQLESHLLLRHYQGFMK